MAWAFLAWAFPARVISFAPKKKTPSERRVGAPREAELPAAGGDEAGAIGELPPLRRVLAMMD